MALYHAAWTGYEVQLDMVMFILGSLPVSPGYNSMTDTFGHWYEASHVMTRLTVFCPAGKVK